MIKFIFIYLIIFTLSSSSGFANVTQAKEQDKVKLKSIKDVLKEDGLTKSTEKKAIIAKEIKNIKEKKNVQKYTYPNEKDFWTFMSEFWLVKNAPVLKWDFQKPNYGLDASFENLLESVGFYHKKFKILILNTTTVTHMGLPGRDGEYIFLISLPFMRSMDLTKLEISILLLEDMLRIDKKLFINNLGLDKKEYEILGKSFYPNKPSYALLEKLIKLYDSVIYKKGFSFQQQFELTKDMDRVLKASPTLWSTYIQMLNKIDRLIKVDLLYTNYNKIFPSPEMQINWLSPKKKHL